MSIKSKLKARAKQHALEAEKAAQLEASIRKQETRKLKEAVQLVRKALEGFEIQEVLALELKVTIPYPRRGSCPQPHVYINVHYETVDVKYADDMQPEPKRCLQVKVGWRPGSVSFICGPPSFEDFFIRFIEQNYVVT